MYNAFENVMSYPYDEFNNINEMPDVINISDHLNGFNEDFSNVLFDKLVKPHTVVTHTIFDEKITNRYPHLRFKFSADMQNYFNFNHFKNYNIHPEINFENFICSFNGAHHTGRQLLVSALNKFGYFNKDYCSKNFTKTGINIEGIISEYVPNVEFYNKFFDCTDIFNQQVYSLGKTNYDHLNEDSRFKHNSNIPYLEHKITQSFLHVVGETLSTGYYPFVTEKSMYSVVTRGLFLAYAQPGWHAHIEKYYGFKLYTKLFDYHFDSITNPVERLVELMTMIGKFSKLTPHEWHDLYLLESDAIEYNYNHYFSNNYLKSLKQFDNTNTI